MEEHLHIEDGKFKGLWNINPENARGDYWTRVQEIIEAYTKLHPIEMELQVRANAKQSAIHNSNHGFSKEKTLQWGVSMPIGLMLKLQAVAPEIFENRNLFAAFKRKYKGLCVCK